MYHFRDIGIGQVLVENRESAILTHNAPVYVSFHRVRICAPVLYENTRMMGVVN